MNDIKIVEFWKWCESCKNRKTPENEEPCHSCLNEPGNLNSHKPVNYSEK